MACLNANDITVMQPPNWDSWVGCNYFTGGIGRRPSSSVLGFWISAIFFEPGVKEWNMYSRYNGI